MSATARIRFPRAAAFVCLTALAAGCPSPATMPRNQHADPVAPVGDFALTERSGKTVRSSDLAGKVWVASFVFTRCTGPCPQISATMARLQKELAGEPAFRLVTFTVDPERDRPEELKQYADHFRADPERWLFLTGPEDDVRTLLRKQFLVPADRNPRAKGPGDEFDHSPRLAVVDRRGRIRGYYVGVRDERANDPDKEFEAEFKSLKDKVSELLREPARPE